MARTHNTSPLIIKRTAIDFSGRLGSLYNGCQDRIAETLNVPFETSSDQLHQITQCILVKGNKNQNRNLLELVDIDEQLRLSLLLNLTSKDGIATVIDHPHIINEYTRIFHYIYIHREERFPDEVEKMREWLPSIMPETNATHIITGVSWGIDIIIILQLPSDDDIAMMIDLTLDKYRAYLNGDRNDFKRTQEDINATENIIDTKTYSNIPDLSRMTTLHDIFHNISRFKMNDTQHQQLSYTLSPIQWFYSQNSTSNYVYIPLDPKNNTKLQQYLFELLISIKTLEIYFNENIPNLLCGHLKERLANANKQWSGVKNEYINIIEQFSKLVIEIRSGRVRVSKLDKKFKSKTQTDIKNRIYNLTQNVIDLNVKGHLISDLFDQQIQYCDVNERGVSKNDNDDTLKRKLIIDENIDRVLCSNDLLNKKNPELLRELHHNLVEELEKNSELRLIYADFSYCDFQLHNMMILPSINHLTETTSKQIEALSTVFTPSVPKTRTSITASPCQLSTPETITVLLLGETGVGKSTFINALVNYLTFKTLDKAQSDKPIVAISVSFPITVGDNFEEYTVKFSDLFNSTNEDFDHPGQSVTQHCKSYTYHLNEKKKLRIIDTPGFGDTRGLDQDDQNMRHILDYIKKFNNLNAICFLLKPNESRLNIFLRSCLTQLFLLLGPDIRNNIVFCFTNTRSTFYSPGDTAPLLKRMLSSLSIHEIPFKKKNTFCFDSESFRYLVARQNKIPFNDREQQIYEMSWTNSVTESNRLIRYICKKLTAYPIPDEYEAIKRAKVNIVHLTHPVVEVMRYILRNIVSRKMNSLKLSIESHANGVLAHEIQNDDYNYQRLPHQPTPLDFLQDYKIVNNSLSEKQDEMIDHLSFFCQISAELGHFLVHVARYRNGDPFLTGLLRLVKEEHDICEDQNRNYINLQLVDGLKKLTNNYEQRIQIIMSNPKHTTLTDIYEWIKYLSEYPLVAEYVIDSCRANVKNNNVITTTI